MYLLTKPTTPNNKERGGGKKNNHNYTNKKKKKREHTLRCSFRCKHKQAKNVRLNSASITTRQLEKKKKRKGKHANTHIQTTNTHAPLCKRRTGLCIIYILSIAQRGKESSEKKKKGHHTYRSRKQTTIIMTTVVIMITMMKKKKTEESHNSVKRPRLGISDKTVNTRRPV